MTTSVNPKGYGSPFVKVFTSKGEISEHIKDFSYTFSEAEDDFASITIETGDVTLLDKPEFQDDAEWVVLWGYREGPEASKRKVYLRDISTDYGSDLITITIKATDKASYLKNTAKNTINKNQNSVEIISNIATRNGIRFLMTDRQGNLIRPTTADIKALEETPTDGPMVLNSSGGLYNDPTYVIPVWKDFVQGGKSDYALANEVIEKTPGGPYVLEGRDDTLTLKKRDFSQGPIRSYTYKGESGELLDFIPETKNRTKKSASANLSGSAWDRETQEYHETNITEADDDSPRLGDEVDGSNRLSEKEQQKYNDLEANANYYEEQLHIKSAQSYNILTPAGSNTDLLIVGNKFASTAPGREVFDVQDNANTFSVVPKNFSSGVDNTATLQNKMSVFDINKYKASVEDFANYKEELKNKRSDEALDKNPATATMVGDPMVISGKVLNILGVAKKHTGNYYVTDATHHISVSDGYTMELTLKRNALSSTGNTQGDKIQVKAIDKPINKSQVDEFKPIDQIVADHIAEQTFDAENRRLAEEAQWKMTFDALPVFDPESLNQ